MLTFTEALFTLEDGSQFKLVGPAVIKILGYNAIITPIFVERVIDGDIEGGVK